MALNGSKCLVLAERVHRFNFLLQGYSVFADALCSTAFSEVITKVDTPIFIDETRGRFESRHYLPVLNQGRHLIRSQHDRDFRECVHRMG